jgi:hypothetical protein
LPAKKRIGSIRRRAVSAAGVIAALAIAAPVAGASAAPHRMLPFAGAPFLPGIAGLPAVPAVPVPPVPLPFIGPAGAAVAIGPTVIGDVFNGGTTVVVSNSAAVGSTNGSP